MRNGWSFEYELIRIGSNFPFALFGPISELSEDVYEYVLNEHRVHTGGPVHLRIHILTLSINEP